MKRLFTTGWERGRLGDASLFAGQSIFNNYLNRTKLNYQFTKELSLR